jgi:hypothetical protein
MKMLVSNKIEIQSGDIVNINVPMQNGTSISVPQKSTTNVTVFGLKSVGVSDANFEYEQTSSSNEWQINHNLNKKPSVTIVDTGDNVVVGEVQYIDNNNLTVSFNASFSGKAYLN